MRKWILAAGAAALAMTAPALADPDNNQGGKGRGNGSEQSKKASEQRFEQSKKASEQRFEQQKKASEQRFDQNKKASEQAFEQDKKNREQRFEAQKKFEEKRMKAAEKSLEARGRKFDDDFDDDRRDGVRVVRRDFEDGLFPGRGLANGCPPGLDKRDNGCMPPGQVRELLGARLPNSFSSAMVPLTMRGWYPDDEQFLYRSGDGFIYRVNRSNNLVDGLIPLFGNGYYALGDQWPQPYDFYNVPNQYRSMWSDGDDYRYRFSDGAIYRLDPTTNAVNAIVALLAGDLGVGSRLPMGYDAYNVPLAYRSQYADTSDAWYRYNDGYIYQVDPKTRLISAVIDAII